MNNKDTLEKIVADIKSQRAHVTVEGVQYISYYYMNDIKDRLQAIIASPEAWMTKDLVVINKSEYEFRKTLGGGKAFTIPLVRVK
jgi:UDP-N-acetylglucosamine enolpyruvyl transferase